jgi:putative colanic acid biosynthesis acetyltransferase WcaF
VIDFWDIGATAGMGMLDAKSAGSRQGGPSFSLRDRLYRAIWIVTWRLLASWTPPPLKRWRRLLLSLFGADIHPTAIIYASSRIWSPANLKMGAFATIGPRVNVYSMGSISLGNYAIVSQGSHLCAGTHDVDDPLFQIAARPIVIGRYAWVAADAFVGPGVTIGEGAVLGARGCAMRNLDAWEVYTGNPAARVRSRRRFELDLA